MAPNLELAIHFIDALEIFKGLIHNILIIPILRPLFSRISLALIASNLVIEIAIITKSFIQSF